MMEKNQYRSPKQHRTSSEAWRGEHYEGCFLLSRPGTLVKIDGTVTRCKYQDILNSAKQLKMRGFTVVIQSTCQNQQRSSFRKRNIKVLEWPSQRPDFKNTFSPLWLSVCWNIAINIQQFWHLLLFHFVSFKTCNFIRVYILRCRRRVERRWWWKSSVHHRKAPAVEAKNRREGLGPTGPTVAVWVEVNLPLQLNKINYLLHLCDFIILMAVAPWW